MSVRIINGDCRAVLASLPDASVQCCVTSPPYFGLRSYLPDGHADKQRELGAEQSPDAYVTEMVAVFSEVRRVLRDDATCWLNLGDSYASHDPAGYRAGEFLNPGGRQPVKEGSHRNRSGNYRPGGAKPKDLLMIPARVALALQADGWWLRSDIIWHKPNPMPESVTDRPTSAHEHVFLLTKSQRYFYDAEAVRQPLSDASYARLAQDTENQAGSSRANGGAKTNGPMKAVRFGGNKLQGNHGSAARRTTGNEWNGPESANLRNVWSICTQPFREAHFATFPPELAERCIKAGSKPGDTILDPFGGAGTTGLVADRLGRNAVLIELNATYADMARSRIAKDGGMFAEVA